MTDYPFLWLLRWAASSNALTLCLQPVVVAAMRYWSVSFVCRKEPSVIVAAQLFALPPSLQKFASENCWCWPSRRPLCFQVAIHVGGIPFFNIPTSWNYSMQYDTSFSFFFFTDFIQILKKKPKGKALREGSVWRAYKVLALGMDALLFFWTSRKRSRMSQRSAMSAVHSPVQ